MQEELKGRKVVLLLLPRCRRGQEFGDTEGRGASGREEGEVDWIPSPGSFFCKFIVIYHLGFTCSSLCIKGTDLRHILQ